MKVPASSGNTGSAFDSTGIAVGLYNEAVLDTEARGITILGEGSGELPSDDRNQAIWALHALADELGEELPPHGLELCNRIPISRGLASSTAGLLAGLVLANELFGRPLCREELMRRAVAIEGHPDNVVPSMLGGIVVTVWDGRELEYVRLVPPEGMRAVVWVPGYGLETSKARAILPHDVPLRDAVFNVSRAALFTAAFATGRFDLLGAATEDRLHQPYRAPLVPGLERMIRESRAAGALAAWLSGAGPSVMALCLGPTEPVRAAMWRVACREGIEGRAIALPLDTEGLSVRTEP